jgi:hypothetical protein
MPDELRAMCNGKRGRRFVCGFTLHMMRLLFLDLETPCRCWPKEIQPRLRWRCDFLEADPWYFRSGYHKEYMIKELRKIPLTEEERKRLQQVILARIQEPKTPREFRRYCRLARFVSDDGFERHVADLVEPSGSVRARHAQWVLAQIRSGRDRLAPKVRERTVQQIASRIER